MLTVNRILDWIVGQYANELVEDDRCFSIEGALEYASNDKEELMIRAGQLSKDLAEEIGAM